MNMSLVDRVGRERKKVKKREIRKQRKEPKKRKIRSGR
jgi:hypothetical protein